MKWATRSGVVISAWRKASSQVSTMARIVANGARGHCRRIIASVSIGSPKEKTARLTGRFDGATVCTLGSGLGSKEARGVIDKFKTDNPAVEIPFPLIETLVSRYVLGTSA